MIWLDSGFLRNDETRIYRSAHKQSTVRYREAINERDPWSVLEGKKPASGKLLLRVPPEVHGRALVAAQAAGKSLNQWATEVLEHAVQPDG